MKVRVILLLVVGVLTACQAGSEDGNEGRNLLLLGWLASSQAREPIIPITVQDATLSRGRAATGAGDRSIQGIVFHSMNITAWDYVEGLPADAYPEQFAAEWRYWVLASTFNSRPVPCPVEAYKCPRAWDTSPRMLLPESVMTSADLSADASALIPGRARGNRPAKQAASFEIDVIAVNITGTGILYNGEYYGGRPLYSDVVHPLQRYPEYGSPPVHYNVLKGEFPGFSAAVMPSEYRDISILYIKSEYLTAPATAMWSYTNCVSATGCASKITYSSRTLTTVEKTMLLKYLESSNRETKQFMVLVPVSEQTTIVFDEAERDVAANQYFWRDLQVGLEFDVLNAVDQANTDLAAQKLAYQADENNVPFRMRLRWTKVTTK